jgi:Tfp pilus assembly protein PilF
VAAYQGLGLVAQRAGDWDEAARDFERAIEIQPDAGVLYQALLAQVSGRQRGRKRRLTAARAQAANG